MCLLIFTENLLRPRELRTDGLMRATNITQNSIIRASKMGQIRVIAIKPGGLDLIPRTHTAERNDFYELSSNLHTHTVAHMCTNTHTNKCKMIFLKIPL